MKMPKSQAFFLLQGFCGWTIVTKDRLLIPSNPEIGVLVYKDNYYAFSTAEVAYDFASRPDYFIMNVAERAKKSPELIQLLELHKQFAAITPYAKVTFLSSAILGPAARFMN